MGVVVVAGVVVADDAGVSLTFSSDFIIKRVQTLGLSTVEVEPPVADEVVLIEDGSVGAEEAVLGQTSSSISCANMENLALSLGVSVISSIYLAITSKSGLGNLGIDWIIFSGDSGNGFL